MMTDHRRRPFANIVKINSSLIDSVTNINAMDGDDDDDDNDTMDDNDTADGAANAIDLPHRDEGLDRSGEVNHVLLGGILIASPAADTAIGAGTMATAGAAAAAAHACRPDCKATRN